MATVWEISARGWQQHPCNEGLTIRFTKAASLAHVHAELGHYTGAPWDMCDHNAPLYNAASVPSAGRI